MRGNRGFTLIEAMVAVAIFATLLGIGAWNASQLLPHWRAGDAARQLAMQVRKAESLALQHNQPVELVFDCAENAPSYTLQGMRWNEALGAVQQVIYERIPIRDEYPGVTVDDAGLAGDVSCAADPAVFELEEGGVSFCGQALRFLPSGGVETPGGRGATVAFLPLTDLESERSDRIRVVAIEEATARVRIYERDAEGWICP